MLRVLNRHIVGLPPGAVYVGRPTKWGNRWRAGIDGTRPQVIDRYRQWLLSQPELVRQAQFELRGKDLVCWCAPRACHAEVLLEVANAPLGWPFE